MNTQYNHIHLKVLENFLKIFSVMIFFVGASLVIPKIPDAHNPKLTNPQTSKNLPNLKLNGEYEPPNYGVPETINGSGTR